MLYKSVPVAVPPTRPAKPVARVDPNPQRVVTIQGLLTWRRTNPGRHRPSTTTPIHKIVLATLRCHVRRLTREFKATTPHTAEHGVLDGADAADAYASPTPSRNPGLYRRPEKGYVRTRPVEVL
jgi:hypothetical protein